MSGTRLTRKVTVEGGKKLPEGGGSNSSSSAGTRRLSVFERLGPGTTERSKPREPREAYPLDKCRNWLRDGRCPFGRNCKFLHGPFSEPKQRKKSMRSVVRSELDRSESERDEGRLGPRTRSLDSLEAEDEEEHLVPPKKKKHKPFEESSDSAKRHEKVKRRQHAEKESSENDEEEADDDRKRRKKVKKRQPGGAGVITKSQSPDQEERDWGYDEFEEERSDGDWEEQGELDYERQLALEKRRQDLQRQLALMDEEEAAIEKAERKVRDVKKDREEPEPRSVPVVHSRLHPDKASVSPGDEPSPVSSQSTPKKKKKKSDGEPKKVKPKRKLSPSSKELKKRKGLHPSIENLRAETEAVERTRKVAEFTSEKFKVRSPQTQLDLGAEFQEKPRVIKKKEVKSKLKEGRATKASEDPYFSPSGPPVEERVRVIPRTPPEEDPPRDKWPYSPDTQRGTMEKVRRRAALSSPESRDSPAPQLPGEERSRRVLVPSEESFQKPSRDGRDDRTAGDQAQYTSRGGKFHDKRYGSPSTPEYGHRRAPVKDPRHTEEGRVEKRRKGKDEGPLHSPSPEDISPRGAATPPEEHRRQRTPPPVDRRGPQTPPGEPELDDDLLEHTGDGRSQLRRKRGPYTPPPPGEAIRPKVDKGRDLREGRSEAVRYREDPDGPRVKERDEWEARYQKPKAEDRAEEFPRGDRGHPQVDEDFSRNRTREEEFVKGRHRDDREEEYHQRTRPKDDRGDESYRTRDREPERANDHHRSRPEEPRGDEHPRRKADGTDDILRRRDERDDDHLRARNREPDKGDERPRRRDERPDEYQRGRGREEHEDVSQRSRVRDYPRRQLEGSDERCWDRGRGDTRETREAPYGDRDRRRQDMPRQDIQENRGRERPGERPRERDVRHPPPGPDYHRRLSPIPQGPRRSPPHGPPRGRSPHRYEERRRSLSPGGRREEGYRPGLPRDQGGFGVGREPMRGRGGYSAPFDNRSRPLEGRRRTSPPPRQFVERGRAGPRGRGGRGGRGFPDRMRPPGERYREQPRDSGGSWDRERRPERDLPRDRGRPHEESRDRDRRPRGDLSPGRGPRHWEDRKGGSPVRGGSPTREAGRTREPAERVPREAEEEHRRKTDEEEEEWEYEEDMGEEKLTRQGERKRPRENASSVSKSLSPVGGKKRRSETPEMKDVPAETVSEGAEKADDEDEPANTAGSVKQNTKLKKRKEGKKEGAATKPEEETSPAGKLPPESHTEPGLQPEGEKRVKVEKKHKKEKGKTKEKGTKKKKKSIVATLAETPEVVTELVEVAAKEVEDGDAPSSETPGEASQSTDAEATTQKVPKKRKHPVAPEDEGAKIRGGDKPPKKKKKKKHQPEVVVQPWADLEGDDEEATAIERETNEPQTNEKDGVQAADTKENEGEKRSDPVKDECDEETTKIDEPPVVKRMEEVFSDWSDDSPIGDDTWSDINEPMISEDKPKADEKETKSALSSDPKTAPSFDDVYDPISDDELDAMLGDEDDDGGERGGDPGQKDSATTPMAVEDVDWSALVSVQSSTEIKEEEPGSHLKRFTPGHVFSRIGISSSLAGPRLTKLVRQKLLKQDPPPANSFGALMAGAAAKRRERETLLTNVGPCRRALCARRDLAMRKRLRRLTGKVGLFQSPSSTPVDNELYLMSVALYKHEPPSTDSPFTKLVPSRVGSVLTP